MCYIRKYTHSSYGPLARVIKICISLLISGIVCIFFMDQTLTNRGLAEAKFVGPRRIQIIYSFINIFGDLALCFFWRYFLPLAPNQLESYFGVK